MTIKSRNVILAIIFFCFGFLLMNCEKKPPLAPNNPPKIDAISISAHQVEPGDSVKIHVIATDLDGNRLQYGYNKTGGIITNPDSPVTFWIAPQDTGTYTITVIVSDGKESVQDSVTINVKRADTSKFGFEENDMGWKANRDTTSQGIYAVEQTFEWAYLGSGSLKMKVNLIGKHPRNYQGEADVDLLDYTPEELTAPVDLDRIKISAMIYTTDENLKGPADSCNFCQIIIKDTKWRSECGKDTDVRIGEPFEITLTGSPTKPPGGEMDDGFDPTDIVMVGVKIGSRAGSTYQCSGTIYMDAFNWNSK